MLHPIDEENGGSRLFDEGRDHSSMHAAFARGFSSIMMLAMLPRVQNSVAVVVRAAQAHTFQLKY